MIFWFKKIKAYFQSFIKDLNFFFCPEVSGALLAKTLSVHIWGSEEIKGTAKQSKKMGIRDQTLARRKCTNVIRSDW